MDSELNARYPSSVKGNFEVWDVISNPHPYTIGNKHLLDDNKNGAYLSIEKAEANGVKCAFMSKSREVCEKTYAQHDRILLIMCHKNLKTKAGLAVNELHNYLLAIKKQGEEEGYKGFAFLEDKNEPKLG